MSQEKPDLIAALTDVRRAYRLLQAYHRRLCDLLFTVHEALVRNGFAFERWAPMNVWTLPKSKTPFFRPEKWAWDLTPGYQVRCEWEENKKDRARQVAIEAIADTGFDAEQEGEPDPSRFKPVEGCVTELRVGTWSARTKEPDWDAAWKKIERLPNPYDGSDKKVKVGGVEYVYRYFTVNVADLVDQGAVNARLLEPLKQWCKKPQP